MSLIDIVILAVIAVAFVAVCIRIKRKGSCADCAQGGLPPYARAARFEEFAPLIEEKGGAAIAEKMRASLCGDYMPKLLALYAESGAKDAFTALDEETLDILDSLGVDVSDPSSLFSVTPAKVVSSAVGLVTGYLAQPLKRCAVIFGLLLLFALTDAAAPSIGKANEAGGMLFMLLLSLAVIAPVAECVSRILSAVRLLSDFTVLLIPVMAGLTAASGKPGSPYSIDAQKCISCGACYQACKFGAIVRQ